MTWDSPAANPHAAEMSAALERLFPCGLAASSRRSRPIAAIVISGDPVVAPASRSIFATSRLDRHGDGFCTLPREQRATRTAS